MIDSFLADSALVDTVIVTVAPLFVGKDGVGYGRGEQVCIPFKADVIYANGCVQMPALTHVKTEMFGHDVVTALKAQH